MFKVPPWEDSQGVSVNNLSMKKDHVKKSKKKKSVSTGHIKNNNEDQSKILGKIQEEKPSPVPAKKPQIITTKSRTIQNKHKRKLDTGNTIINNNNSAKTREIDFDQHDEVILNTRKNKIIKFNHDEVKDIEETFNKTSVKDEQKKRKLERMLKGVGHRSEIKVAGNSLRERMLLRLRGAQFRYLNEKLYTSSGSDAQKLFKEDPNAFQTYHEGYQQQVKKWPVNPLDVIVKRILQMPKSLIIADMGCGKASLSQQVPNKVRSFDLVAANTSVEVCDIAHTPLLSCSVDVAVYCLALMGTDLTQYLLEANRVLKVGGHLLIAEVESRFGDVEEFTKDLQRLGFSLKKVDKSNKVFYFIEFIKSREAPKKSKLPIINLKPCLYKKR
ncbi:unnamed protein product [Leptidea sinapis]|uniref:Ribosomal RNA-processing protein 8 n=1 Tax=Leptidea sinapis TaxID=189913 RepID=A0A5E4Q0V6_9NEOP|nr:unnamed protein product [Leptidea sinapis]